MGRGDKKSKKGKIWKGSYGVSRNKAKIKSRLKKKASTKVATAAVEAPKAKRASKKKADA